MSAGVQVFLYPEELEHLRRERFGLHVLELLRVEEDLHARAHA